MWSSMLRLHFIIASIAFARGGVPGWCDPHPDIPGAIIMPTGPVREGQHVVILCYASSATAGNPAYTKFDWCLDGGWVPGVRSCDQHSIHKK